MLSRLTNGPRRKFILASLLLLSATLQTAAAAPPTGRPLPAFRKIVLTERYYCDGITSGTINDDAYPDIVAGPYWYEGPDFTKRHEFYEAVLIPTEPSPSNSMFSFIHDFNTDGRNDILVLGRVHKHPAMWYENTGEESGLWPAHHVFERIRGESPTLTVQTSTTAPRLLSHWEGRWGFVTQDPDVPDMPWQFQAIGENEDWPQFYHGQGMGDVNGDGLSDVILNDGWYQQPEVWKPGATWQFHRGRFSLDRGGAQMFAEDVDGDGDQDIITALHAHAWGLAWFEQLADSDDLPDPDLRLIGDTKFRQHLIMHDRTREKELGVAFSQPHALALADIDGDGHNDIVTGKRMWAHGPDGDVEPNAAPVLYWFQWSKTESGQVRFIPHLIDDASGVGVQVSVSDVNSDDRPDILTVSKLGAFVFLNVAK